ncbi:hypothetical protein [Georhizobium profundi]|nr:hypothetical protein [Georhizobium profundi]
MQAVFGLLSSGFQAVTGALTGAAGAAGVGATTTAAGATAATAAQTLSLSQLMQGGATVLSMFSSIQAGNADAQQANLAAIDAEREVPLETLQGINRRASIKRQLMDSIGTLDTAYAGSGVDLSFGTPSVARSEAFREADRALNSDAMTEQTRVGRLNERAANYRRAAGRARSRGFFDAIGTGLKGAASFLNRG